MSGICPFHELRNRQLAADAAYEDAQWRDLHALADAARLARHLRATSALLAGSGDERPVSTSTAPPLPVPVDARRSPDGERRAPRPEEAAA